MFALLGRTGIAPSHRQKMPLSFVSELRVWSHVPGAVAPVVPPLTAS
jgi:hypothetical protein